MDIALVGMIYNGPKWLLDGKVYHWVYHITHATVQIQHTHPDVSYSDDQFKVHHNAKEFGFAGGMSCFL